MICFKNKTNEIRMGNVNFVFYHEKKANIGSKSSYFDLLKKFGHKLEKQACYFAKVPLICL